MEQLSVVDSAFLGFESDDPYVRLRDLGAYIFEAFEHLEAALLDPLHEHRNNRSKSGKTA